MQVILMNNPFPYSLDNKRYQTWNYYLQTTFHTKVAKVPINAYFTCPNRDGTKGFGGCTFCSGQGSGDFPIDPQKDLLLQFEQRKAIMENKWPNCAKMVYFQAYTNTYAPLETLKQLYQPFVEKEDVIGICIGTRSDCLTQECIDYLQSITKQKEVWIRHVVVPGINDSSEDVLKLKDMLNKYDCISKIELLPFKNLCLEKYETLGIEFPLKDTKPLSSTELEKLNKLI